MNEQIGNHRFTKADDDINHASVTGSLRHAWCASNYNKLARLFIREGRVEENRGHTMPPSGQRDNCIFPKVNFHAGEALKRVLVKTCNE